MASAPRSPPLPPPPPDPETSLFDEAVSYLKYLLPRHFTLHTGIIGGSGLTLLEEAIGPFGGEKRNSRLEVPYESIDGWPRSTVTGHAGKLVFGQVGGTNVVLMSGRAHLYEGNDLRTATFPIRVLSLLGMKTLIVTNAAGGLNRSFKVGDVVLLNDHINFPGLSGVNPLSGPNLESFGPRFLGLSDAYELELRRTAHQAWKELRENEIRGGTAGGMALHEGVYAYVGGPNYETRAECRMLAILGADMVGMSTVPEVLVARHSNIRVLALSLISNMAVVEHSRRGDDPELANAEQADLEKVMEEGKANHEEVVDVGRRAATEIKKLITRIVELEGAKKR